MPSSTLCLRLNRCGVGVHHSTVGIVGLGRIGFSVAEKLRAFKPARILYHNRNPNEESWPFTNIFSNSQEPSFIDHLVVFQVSALSRSRQQYD